MYCKRIRDYGGYWNQVEVYVKEHSNADFSHSICPDCMGKHYPEYSENIDAKEKEAKTVKSTMAFPDRFEADHVTAEERAKNGVKP